MAPKLSPKKSIEGAVGGVVGAALLAIIYGFVFKDANGMHHTDHLVYGRDLRSGSTDLYGGRSDSISD